VSVLFFDYFVNCQIENHEFPPSLNPLLYITINVKSRNFHMECNEISSLVTLDVNNYDTVLN